MEKDGPTPCANCQRLQAQIDALQAELAHLREQVASLSKDSSTSSKPPSSDIVKPPKPSPPPGQDSRKPGGQPGHAPHFRQPFTPQQLTAPPQEHRLLCCPGCGGSLHPSGCAPRVVQQVEVLQAPLAIEEHRSIAGWCPRCCATHYAPLPEAVQAGGLLGPRLTALVGYLKGACHASFSTIRKSLRDVVGVTVSRGHLVRVIAKVSDALEGPYEGLLACLRTEPVLNVDETGHKDKGDAWWTWCFRAELYTLFKVDPRRSADVLMEVLGEEFGGVIGCDHFSAYRRYMRECGVAVQFCLAHLIRDVKYLMTLPGLEEILYGLRLELALKGLFGVIHRREQLPAEEFARGLQQAKAAVLKAGQEEVPQAKACQAMAKRLAKYGQDYFTFITTPGLGPTNNLAEQAIRFVVIDRVVTQGTRGEAGRRFCERMWTALATCAQQGRSAFEYLEEAVQAHFQGSPAPALAPAVR
jgi:transposase